MNGDTVGTYIDEINSCAGACGASTDVCASASTTSMMKFSMLLSGKE